MGPREQIFGELTAVVLAPKEKATKALVLLHGVGSNEVGLLGVAQAMAPERLIISLRAPLTMGPGAFGWFQVQFQAGGPVHDWDQARSSLTLLEEAFEDISKQTGIPSSKISLFGFSQGAIMTLGLALRSPESFESYVACAGRTLPEFAEGAKSDPVANFSARKILVVHGTLDSKLPLAHAKNTEKVLRQLGADLTYREFATDHGVTPEVAREVSSWLREV